MSTKAPSKKSIRIVVGKTQFRYVYADSRALWRVVRATAADTYLCEIVDEPIVIDGRTYSGDYAGVQQPFLRSQIIGALSWDDAITSLMDENEAWWHGQEVGETLHYHNSFGKFVRGEVVIKDGKKALRPTALVGAWAKHDLPKRDATGQVVLGYHAGTIAEGEAWQPSASTVYESGKVGDRNGDPRTMPAIDLTLPEPTEDERDEYARGRLLADARLILDDWASSSQDRLNALRALLDNSADETEPRL